MKFIFLSAFLALNTWVFAQASGSGVGGSSTVQKRMEVYSWAQRPESEESFDLQKMFLNQQWMPGVVHFKSGRPAMLVPLIFDMHNNTLYYLQGQVIMEFVDTVSDFILHVPAKKDSIQLKFKSQFPAIQANSPETFYEVLVEGNLKLLKCRAKSILLFKDKSLPEEKREELHHLYFVELPGNKLVMIPLDADGIKEKLPDYDAVISEVLKKDHLRIKNENKLIELFVHLNNEQK